MTNAVTATVPVPTRPASLSRPTAAKPAVGTANGPRNTASGVPRWADLAARATVWTTVPSGLWRVALGLGVPVGFSGELAATADRYTPGWGTAYVVLLSVLAEALAFLTVGLVRPWGEVVPRWIPLIGGRTVHPLAAIVPATLGSAALIWVGMSSLFGGWAAAMNNPEAPHGAAGLIMTLCYLPLVAWGPLVAVVTIAYARRTLGRR
ncbi:hypothetical protein ACWDRR_16595 [Kitasatospora sp. NPDC003701]